LLKVHPYADFAWRVTSSLYKVDCCVQLPILVLIVAQAVREQLERDAKLVTLVMTMEDVYQFVEVSDSFQKKISLLERTVDNILKQTVECTIFIREYTGHGFGGEHRELTAREYINQRTRSLGRLLRDTMSDNSQKITDLIQALISLKQALDSTNILQAVFISTRTLEGIERLGERTFATPFGRVQ